MYGLLSYPSSKGREYQAGSSKQDDPVKFLKGAMAILLRHVSWQAQSQTSPATLFSPGALCTLYRSLTPAIKPHL